LFASFLRQTNEEEKISDEIVSLKYDGNCESDGTNFVFLSRMKDLKNTFEKMIAV